LFDTASVRFEPDADTVRIARETQALPGVVVYVPVKADLNSVADARPIFATIIDVFLAIGALIALIGVASALVVHRHTGDVSRARFALEASVAVLVGVVVGSVLGTIGARRLVNRLDTDLIHLVHTVDASTYVVAALVVLVVSAAGVVIGTLTDPPAGPPLEPARESRRRQPGPA
jgi:chromate transport protein ChrA